MRKIALDYQRTGAPRQIPGWFLLFAAVVLAGWLVEQYMTTTDHIDALEARVQRLQRLATRTDVMAQTKTTAATAALRIKLAKYGVQAWNARFAPFEQAASDAVTLLSLTPDKGKIAVVAEAKDISSVLDYVRTLQRSPALAEVHVTNTEALKDKAAKAVRFTVAASWAEATR